MHHTLDDYSLEDLVVGDVAVLQDYSNLNVKYTEVIVVSVGKRWIKIRNPLSTVPITTKYSRQTGRADQRDMRGNHPELITVKHADFKKLYATVVKEIGVVQEAVMQIHYSKDPRTHNLGPVLQRLVDIVMFLKSLKD
jgi:hypothetical protein